MAIASVSGTPLALAPDAWPDGCAVRREPVGDTMVVESYLDPSCGRTLIVEVKPNHEGRIIDAIPRRWSQWRP